MSNDAPDRGTLDAMQSRVDREIRHQRAMADSDIQHLRDTLRAAAERCEDVAELLEEDRTYDPVHFLRASAHRCRLAADNKS